MSLKLRQMNYIFSFRLKEDTRKANCRSNLISCSRYAISPDGRNDKLYLNLITLIYDLS